LRRVGRGRGGGGGGLCTRVRRRRQGDTGDYEREEEGGKEEASYDDFTKQSPLIASVEMHIVFEA